MGVEESYLSETEAYSPGLLPELKRDEAKSPGPCMLQNNPSLGKAGLWQDKTKA